MTVVINGTTGITTPDLNSSDITVTDIIDSTGIYLGGTGSANKLDDYEEGTWTPTIFQGASSVTYSSQSGSYTKIGHLVVLTFELTFSAFTGTANNCEIGGFPFAATNSTNNRGQASLLIDNLTVTENHPLLQVTIGTNRSVLVSNVGSTSSHAGLQGNKLTASTTIRANLFYRTAA